MARASIIRSRPGSTAGLHPRNGASVGMLRSATIGLSIGLSIGLALSLALPMLAVGPSTAPTGSWSSGIDAWVTDLDTDQRLQPQPRLGWRAGAGAAANTIVVDPTRRYQEMTGFGASMTDSSAHVLSALPAATRRGVMRDLFSPVEGIGISMLRQPMGASDFAVERAYTYDDQPAGESDPDLSEFSIRHDRRHILPRLQEAYALNPTLTFMATPWSAPGWMKTSDSLVGGSLRPRYHQAYANYFARFIRAYQREGIPTDYVSMQNEPLYEPADYPGMRVLPDQAAIFLGRHLGPTLERAGLRDTKILGYDHNWDVPDYPEAMYADPGSARQVTGTAWHCYAGRVVAQSISHNNYPHAQAFQTECSGGGWQTNAAGVVDRDVAFDQTMASIIGVPRNWGQSVVFWNLALDQDRGPFIGGCDVCRPVLTVDTESGAVTKEMEFWALAHATRFVRPGSTRIGSSVHPTAAESGAADHGLTNVVFSTRSGEVLIAHNATGTTQTFDVQVGDRHFRASLPPGAAATYRWSSPDRLPPVADLGWVDLDFGRGPRGTPTGRLIASVGPEVVAGLTQVKAGDRWIGYTLPYGAELLARAATSLPRAGWTVEVDGGRPVEGESVAGLIDGDPRTRWSSGTGQGPTLSLTMHLGGPATFSEIALDTAQSPGDFLRRYLVEVSDDGTSWNRIARGPGRPTLAGAMSIMVPRTTAAHVRIRSDEVSGSWWSVHELDLRLSEGPASLPPGPELVSDTGELTDGTAVSGHYNSGARPAVVPWSVPGFDYSYRLPPRAAVTVAVVAASAVERLGPTLSRRGPRR